MTDKNFAKSCRNAIPEGIVLLESDGSLPFAENENIAFFGRGQFEYLKSGSGSGGRVNCPYVTNIYDEIKNRVNLDSAVLDFYRDFVKENPFDEGDGWQPCFCQKEADLKEELVRESAKRNKKAVYVICRNIGEGYDYEKKRATGFCLSKRMLLLNCLPNILKMLLCL